ncbi:MAG: hypothetical protein GY835_26920 [bacterium]|nr:hypothetical protein [bacterium]
MSRSIRIVLAALLLTSTAAGSLQAQTGSSPFLTPQYIVVPNKQIFDIEAGDFDGLGGPDLALVSYLGDHLVVMINQGLGRFGEPVIYPAGDGTISLVVEDLTGDGILDIATIGRRDHALRLFIGQGDGTFVAGASWQTGTEPIQLVAAELNGQPGIDLACTNLGGINPVFSIYLNNGSGSFSHTNYTSEAGQRGITAADINGDGRDDIVMTLYGAGKIAIHLNDGAGHFGSATTLTTVDKPYSICARDLDGNSTVDIVITHKDDNNEIWAIPGLGNGMFGIPLTWSAPEIMDCLLLSDLDADNDIDLIVTSSESGMIGILYQPSGNAWEDPIFHDGGEGAYASVAADFDMDGDNDIMVSSYWTTQLTYLENKTIQIPVFISYFNAEPAPGSVRLEWLGGNDTGPVDFRVLARSNRPNSPTRIVGGEISAAGSWQAIDRHTDLLTGGSFTYTLEAHDGNSWLPYRTISTLVPGLPVEGGLLEILPGMGSDDVRIHFTLLEGREIALTIHDLRGRRLTSLATGSHKAGGHEYAWDGRDVMGRRQASGIYFVSLRGAGGLALNRKILIMR